MWGIIYDNVTTTLVVLHVQVIVERPNKILELVVFCSNVELDNLDYISYKEVVK